MKKLSVKRIITIILVITAALCYCGIYGYAAEKNVISAETSESGIVYESKEDAASYIRSQMKERKKSFSLTCRTREDKDKLLHDLIDMALEHTGEPEEGDYLKYQYENWRGEYSWTQDVDGFFNVRLTYTLKYYTTTAQESKLDDSVKEALSGLKLKGKTDYQKIEKIYNYICRRVKYDYDTSYDESNMIKFSAYGAQVKRKAVCQGYAVLLYRMLLSQGIDCRIITGTANGGTHAWNIVRLGDQYYNLDPTWDSVLEGKNYFLKSDSGFDKHTRDAEFKTSRFNKQYPMSKKSFDAKSYCTAKLPKSEYTYTGKVIKPAVTVWNASGKKLVKGTDYTVKHIDAGKRAGRYKVKITGKGGYSFTKYLYFSINPKGTSLKSLTPCKGGFKAVWKKQTIQTSGYQLRYSMNSSMSSAKIITVKGSGISSKTLSNLKNQKQYYVQIRTFKTVDGVKYCSKWSEKKSVTTMQD